MSGYSGYSMSNNAVDAYESGEKPRSKWTKKVLLSAIFSIEQMAVVRRSLQTAFNESSVWTRRTTTRFRPSKHKKKTTLGGLFLLGRFFRENGDILNSCNLFHVAPSVFAFSYEFCDCVPCWRSLSALLIILIARCRLNSLVFLFE